MGKKFLKKLTFIRSGFKMDIVLNEFEQKRIIDKGDNFFVSDTMIAPKEILGFYDPAYTPLLYVKVKNCIPMKTTADGVELQVNLIYFERCVE